jgi:hypothetical protein
MLIRDQFNPDLGDRVARVPGSRVGTAAISFSEAFQYAWDRSVVLDRRVTLRRHSKHNWWLVLTERPGRR